MTSTEVKKARTLRGAVRVPGDKSASHRAFMISALADGVSTIKGASNGEDVERTREIVRLLGATISHQDGGWSVVGPTSGLSGSAVPLDCGNSGTAMRLLAGLLTGVTGTHHLIGDQSLMQRPMERVVVPLRSMGAQITASESGTAPIKIEGGLPLAGIDFEVPTPSAQVKSAVLFAALGASSPTVIRESIRTRSTTEEMLLASLIDVVSEDQGAGRFITINPGRPMTRHWTIPGDPSQAAFFAVLGAIHGNASIGVINLLNEPERTGFMQVLKRMGGLVSLEQRSDSFALRVRTSSLHSTEIHSSEIPSVDEVPVLAIAAAAATGVTAFRDMGELRVKESDRFLGSMKLAQAIGCETWAEGDDFYIRGLGSADHFSAFTLDAGLDHRIVMSAAVAATAGNGGTIVNWKTVESSYPAFFEDLISIQ